MTSGNTCPYIPQQDLNDLFNTHVNFTHRREQTHPAPVVHQSYSPSTQCTYPDARREKRNRQKRFKADREKTNKAIWVRFVGRRQICVHKYPSIAIAPSPLWPSRLQARHILLKTCSAPPRTSYAPTSATNAYRGKAAILSSGLNSASS